MPHFHLLSHCGQIQLHYFINSRTSLHPFELHSGVQQLLFAFLGQNCSQFSFQESKLFPFTHGLDHAGEESEFSVVLGPLVPISLSLDDPHEDPLDGLYLHGPLVDIADHEYLGLKQIEVVIFVFQIGGDLDNGPLNFAVDGQTGSIPMPLPGRDDVVVDAQEPGVVLDQPPPVAAQGVLEQAHVLESRVADVDLAELVVVQVEYLHLGEGSKLQGHLGQEVAGQVELDQPRALGNGGQLGLLYVGARQDQQLQGCRLLYKRAYVQLLVRCCRFLLHPWQLTVRMLYYLLFLFLFIARMKNKNEGSAEEDVLEVPLLQQLPMLLGPQLLHPHVLHLLGQLLGPLVFLQGAGLGLLRCPVDMPFILGLFLLVLLDLDFVHFVLGYLPAELVSFAGGEGLQDVPALEVPQHGLVVALENQPEAVLFVGQGELQHPISAGELVLVVVVPDHNLEDDWGHFLLLLFHFWLLFLLFFLLGLWNRFHHYLLLFLLNLDRWDLLHWLFLCAGWSFLLSHGHNWFSCS